MDDGKKNSTVFVRQRNGRPENVILSYAPVNVPVITPLNPGAFSAGCNVSSKLVYSLGIGIVESDLNLRYAAVEKSLEHNLMIARGVSIGAMLLIAILFTILTYFISLNIARPIIALTKIVKSIKTKSLRDEIPEVDG